jgi:voltage-gated potassium channel
MRLWLRTLIRNSFFQVGAGIFLVMVSGGFIVRFLETGDIARSENPFWWTIVTMTTVGYGDFTPETLPGRFFAVIVMFAGISLISLLTATISSIFVAKKIREGKGLEKVDAQDHIILCGWNKNGDQILESIQYLTNGKRVDLVLINDLNEDRINQLKTRYRGLRIHYVAGDFTQEKVLERANIHEADTVVIIPNQTDGTIGSPDERTIFATLTIKSMEPNLRVIAYINEQENLTHIRRANADEVVLSDDFGAYMVAAHIIDPGIPQLVNTLLDNKSPSRFKRVPIPKSFVGKKYEELFNHFREKHHWVLVGVYSEEENLGIGEILSADTSALDAFIERKLREGGISLQEESRITTVINPDSDYLIKEGERAIVIE